MEHMKLLIIMKTSSPIGIVKENAFDKIRKIMRGSRTVDEQKKF